MNKIYFYILGVLYSHPSFHGVDPVDADYFLEKKQNFQENLTGLTQGYKNR